VRSDRGLHRACIVLLIALAAACTHGVERPFRVLQTQEGHGLRLALLAAPGARINARLKPALERPDGSVLRFDSPALTPDSAYFAAPPELVLEDGQAAEGIIRASVCRSGESVCRLVTVDVRGET